MEEEVLILARTDLFRELGGLFARAGGTRLTRRQFLKSALFASGLTAFGLSSNPSIAWQTEKNRPGSVTIVGAGLAGLVAAYRLMRQGVPSELYEATARLGGRVFSRRGFNGEGMFCELGGELIDTPHEAIQTLCRELGVTLEAFVPSGGESALLPALYITGGQIRAENDVIEAFKPLAERLTSDLALMFPDGEITIPTYRASGQAVLWDRMTLAAYLDGTPGLAPWLNRLIRVAYTGEYGLEAREQSALNLLLLISPETGEGFKIFGASDEAMRIQGGNSALPEALARAIRERVPIRTGQRLVAIADDGEALRLTFQHGSRKTSVRSGKVVLALPFSVLRRVEGIDRIGLSPVKLRCIRELGYGTNSKQMIGFRSRFWRDGARGPAGDGSLYTDWESQCYWETSRLQPGRSGILTNFLGGEAGRLASAGQVRKALADLSVLYPQARSEFDGRTAFFNWSRFPFAGGSYTCPRPGQYTALIGSAHEPELNGRLFFAGEHCSVDWMGFMNGAVESGNVAAALLTGDEASIGKQPLAIDGSGTRPSRPGGLCALY